MTGSNTEAVSLKAASHRYGAVMALDGVDFTLPTGASVAVIGPDGVGKSTVLGLIAGVRKLQAGQLQVLGGDMADRRHRDRVAARIAYMPQGLGRNLYPTLSVVENIDFFGRLYGQSAAERQQRITRLLQATGLDPFPDRPAGKLSGGMRQKLSLCCALIHDPDLLILDEPTTGVDPLSRRQFWTLIEAIRAERPGITVIVATAYMEEAARFGHLVVMGAGRVLAAGAMDDVLAQAGATTPEAAYRVLSKTTATPLIIPPRPAEDGPPAIEAEGLTRDFNGFKAVDSVSFCIGKGEIFGFLGSNGCGKTTTMKMLTGLLPASAGTARLLGQPIAAGDMQTRLRVGYMSQSFSLYEELTVRANLLLHARLYRAPGAEVAGRVQTALEEFDLGPVADSLPTALPLGIRQRLQLAAACLHRPEVLILDEPTSGVDPAARDMFWRLLVDLSRRDGVTIFISTHFMNEAERCDRVSLMHAGRVLAVDTPQALRQARGVDDLEEAFVGYLQDATEPAKPADATLTTTVVGTPIAEPHDALVPSIARIWAFARREMVEVLRDRVRLAFALLGPLALLITFGFGISFDVENLPFAVFDQDQSLESRRLVENFEGSRYFEQRAPIFGEGEITHRLRAGDVRLVIAIPPDFGRDMLRGHKPDVAVYLDGAMPFRAETARGYVQGIALSYVQAMAATSTSPPQPTAGLDLQPRFRYNQQFRSAVAILPGCIMVLLLLIPAMLTALGVVREREIGSISNLYASPATVGEFLLGKQAPYLLIGLISFFSLTALAWAMFGVTVRGSAAALLLGAALYVFAATAFGLLVSTFVRTQVAAIIATAILCVVPAINFSGYLYPAATLEGAGRIIGLSFPALWFQNISLGTFAKARPFTAFFPEYLMLFGLGAAFLLLASLLLRKQER